jgi:hypothetical protein
MKTFRWSVLMIIAMFFVMGLCSQAWARPPMILKEKKEPTVLKNAELTAKLPNLTITKIYRIKDCRVAVTIKNLGPGSVPDTVWTEHTPNSPALHLYRNGTKWGKEYIWKFDTAKKLKNPGGTVDYESQLQVTETATIKAVVDAVVVVNPPAKSKSLQTRLTCPGTYCLVGTYDCTFQPPPCVEPEISTFVLDIFRQSADCGPHVDGRVKILSLSNVTYRFEGTILCLPPGMTHCFLDGYLTVPPSAGIMNESKIRIRMAGQLRKEGGKCYLVDGGYIIDTKCSGTLTMQQR